MDSIPVELHPLAPFLPVHARVLLLGSFPPQAKRWSMDFYYPNFQNDMWRIMGFLFYEDRSQFVDLEKKKYCKSQIVSFLNEKGIALYDTAESVRRLKDNASDNYLEIVQPTRIENLLSTMPHCSFVVTTGEKAAKEISMQYAVEKPAMGQCSTLRLNEREILFFRMPSTSRAYPMAFEEKANYYRSLFQKVGILDNKQSQLGKE